MATIPIEAGITGFMNIAHSTRTDSIKDFVRLRDGCRAGSPIARLKASNCVRWTVHEPAIPWRKTRCLGISRD